MRVNTKHNTIHTPWITKYHLNYNAINSNALHSHSKQLSNAHHTSTQQMSTKNGQCVSTFCSIPKQFTIYYHDLSKNQILQCQQHMIQIPQTWQLPQTSVVVDLFSKIAHQSQRSKKRWVSDCSIRFREEARSQNERNSNTWDRVELEVNCMKHMMILPLFLAVMWCLNR